MKSDNVKKGVARAPHRSLFYASGYTDEELDQPLVGIICAKNEGAYDDFLRDQIEPVVCGSPDEKAAVLLALHEETIEKDNNEDNPELKE